MALDMLGITVWFDDENIEVTDAIKPESERGRCADTQRGASLPLNSPDKTSTQLLDWPERAAVDGRRT